MFSPILSILKWAFTPGRVETFEFKAVERNDKARCQTARDIKASKNQVYTALAFSIVSGFFAMLGTNNSQLAHRACIVLTCGGICLTLKAVQKVYEAARPLHSFILKK